MINIGLPPPMLSRLRLHWHVTKTAFTRQTTVLREVAAHTATITQEVWQQTGMRLISALTHDRQPALPRRQTSAAAAFAVRIFL